MTFRDVPVRSLKAIEQLLTDTCPPVVVRSASNLADEKERLRMMFDAGRFSVLEDVRNAIGAVSGGSAAGKGKPNG